MISMKLDEYTPNQFSYDFFPQGERKRDYSSIGEYSAALKSLRNICPSGQTRSFLKVETR